MEDILDFIQREVYKNDMSASVEHIYGDAVSETINNVQMHAYPNCDDGKWWLLCSVIDGSLFLAIYDSGVGMPNTVVERKWFFSALRFLYPLRYEDSFDGGDRLFFFKRFKDSELINMSMCGDVSRTRNSKHGQGSKSIKALVSDSVEGSLLVYSKKGLYKFSREENKPELYNLPKPVSGTLIQWNIELK